jgi:hypothetical protein
MTSARGARGEIGHLLWYLEAVIEMTDAASPVLCASR